MRAIFLMPVLFISLFVSAQSNSPSFSKAWDTFSKDPQLKYAIAAITIVDASSGKILFEKNGETGMAPASTQKIITSVAGFEILGKDYKYKTFLGYSGQRIKDSLVGLLFIRGKGDPSLGSDRFASTKPATVFNQWVKKIKEVGLGKLPNGFFVDESAFNPMRVPGGWIVDDIGNYYGAGAGALNWRENQYELRLESGQKIGDPVSIKTLNGQKEFYHDFSNQLKSAAKGTGDNAYIYLPLAGSRYQLHGTIPIDEKNFEISGSVVDPADYLIDSFRVVLERAKLLAPSKVLQYTLDRELTGGETIIDTYYSPNFDSLNYYFLRNSINLYGEAFVKTIALEKTGLGSTEKGLDLIKKFFSSIGVDPDAISIIDGSGLSPQNRVTTRAITSILRYAKKKSWYANFLQALPEYNGMKMKSGYISGVRAFCGYHQSKAGVSYSYSIIVNNFRGSSAEITKKIYKLLDNLK